jgi:hypothetical protein
MTWQKKSAFNNIYKKQVPGVEGEGKNELQRH